MHKKLIILFALTISTMALYGCESDSNILDTYTLKENEIISDVELYNSDETEYDVNEEIYNETDEDNDTEVTEEEDNDWGSAGAMEDAEFTIYEMLVYAIQDEYTARAEYEYIIEEFDVTKPFSNIVKSEETHISLLIPLFEAYGFDVPEDLSSDHLFELTTLEETFAIGVTAEINNIAMYDLFLEQELPDDIADAFVKLRDASENHLAAFQKNLDRY